MKLDQKNITMSSGCFFPLEDLSMFRDGRIIWGFLGKDFLQDSQRLCKNLREPRCTRPDGFEVVWGMQ